jgi:hypothetical protein
MEADAEAAKIEARYSDEDLLRLIRAHGVDETLAPAESAVDANTNTATDSATNTVTLTTPTQETP